MSVQLHRKFLPRPLGVIQAETSADGSMADRRGSFIFDQLTDDSSGSVRGGKLVAVRPIALADALRIQRPPKHARHCHWSSNFKARHW